LIEADSDERTWSSLLFVCIESENRVDLRLADMRVRRRREVPPAINIPALPPALDPAEITQLVQQIVRPTCRDCRNDSRAMLLLKVAIACRPQSKAGARNYPGHVHAYAGHVQRWRYQ
jgi:hypothetical protein